MGDFVSTAEAGASVLTTLTENAKSLMSLAVQVGADILNIPLVQIFLSVTVLSISISLIAKAVRKFRH